MTGNDVSLFYIALPLTTPYKRKYTCIYMMYFYNFNLDNVKIYKDIIALMVKFIAAVKSDFFTVNLLHVQVFNCI